MLVSAVSNIFSAQVSGKLGTTKTIILSYALSIPFYLMIALSPSFSFASAMIISRVAIVNLGSPLMQSLFMRTLQPGEKSTGSSVLMMVQRIAQAFAAWLGGQLMSKVGLNSPIFLGVGLYILYTVVAQVLLTPLDNRVEATAETGESIVKAAPN